MSKVRPSMFAHVVYRTRRFEEMIDWYSLVFGATMQQQNPALAFMTYDDEHHRFAFVNLDVTEPGTEENDQRGLIGVDHVAYSLASVEELFELYARLKEEGITPYWTIHHGMTVSMYYADPDGNQMEFQVDAFDSKEACNEFMRGPVNAANPVGVEFDPEDWLARMRAGEAAGAFRVRQEHEPMSPVRRSPLHMPDNRS